MVPTLLPGVPTAAVDAAGLETATAPWTEHTALRPPVPALLHIENGVATCVSHDGALTIRGVVPCGGGLLAGGGRNDGVL